MSYATPRPETPSRPASAKAVLVERVLKDALAEIDTDRLIEAVDPGEAVLGFFR